MKTHGNALDLEEKKHLELSEVILMHITTNMDAIRSVIFYQEESPKPIFEKYLPKQVSFDTPEYYEASQKFCIFRSFLHYTTTHIFY